MKSNKLVGKIQIGMLSLLLATAPPTLGWAHEAKCPHCESDLTQDTPEQDNEVALRYGKKRIEYKCVMCAIADAEKSYKGDLKILAPSEIKGKPVEIARTEGKWSAPESTVFIGHKIKHRYCERGYRAFTTMAAFTVHVEKNKAQLKGAKPVTLAEIVQIAKSDVVEDQKEK